MFKSIRTEAPQGPRFTASDAPARGRLLVREFGVITSPGTAATKGPKLVAGVGDPGRPRKTGLTAAGERVFRITRTVVRKLLKRLELAISLRVGTVILIAKPYAAAGERSNPARDEPTEAIPVMFCATKRVIDRLAAVTVIAVFCVLTTTANAQFFRQPAVGGVKIDAEGVVTNPEVGELKELQAAWQQGLADVPADLEQWSDLRFVSLRQLETKIAEARAAGKPLPDAVRFLAGLQRVRYVLVYPERQDIVLAGPAEGWRVDAMGSVVGATSGRPVLTLDDLMVALRVAESSNRSGISCSIDPTPEGMQRMQQLSGRLSARGGPQAAGRQMEEAVGPQRITITGVPDTSHFARVIVAADFRMKRLAMDFERAPVDGMPSFLDMVRTGRGRGLHNMMPRWWLAAMYDPLQRDEDGLAWELRGQGVRCLTEQDFLTGAGQREHTGKADPTAQKWADTFTQKFDELAREDSSFGQLRNVMDLAVVGALMFKEGLLQRSGLEAPNLMNDQPLDEYPAPRMVPSQATFVKAGRNWVVSVSGGVQIFPWQVADRTEISESLASTRAEQSSAASGWYWQR